MLSGKSIVLGVTGGIAAYKTAHLASYLTQQGAQVDVVMTEAATKFIAPLTFQSLTQRPVTTDMFTLPADMHVGHVSLAQRANLVAVAPATANTIAKIAHGIADDMLTTTVLATTAPILMAPAMDANMYSNIATQSNMDNLRRRGVRFVGPAYGRLASGITNYGRMVEVTELIEVIQEMLSEKQDFKGIKVVVTAGGTQEPIDPVRYIGNHSSGKMGYAIAEAARDRGAVVTLVSGPVSLPKPPGIELLGVKTARQMQAVLRCSLENAKVLIMAAAVADYRVAEEVGHKIKKTGSSLNLRLVQNPDIIGELAEDPLAVGVLRVGFAAESQNLIENATDKLGRKKLDLLVANDISAPDSGFGSDTNRVVLLQPGRTVEALPLMSKRQVAERILDRVSEILNQANRHLDSTTIRQDS
jgi:phosphopantothenoylcysteine decarboxylase/phosphopantothenate--cysteine ligase